MTELLAGAHPVTTPFRVEAQGDLLFVRLDRIEDLSPVGLEWLPLISPELARGIELRSLTISNYRMPLPIDVLFPLPATLNGIARELKTPFEFDFTSPVELAPTDLAKEWIDGKIKTDTLDYTISGTPRLAGNLFLPPSFLHYMRQHLKLLVEIAEPANSFTRVAKDRAEDFAKIYAQSLAGHLARHLYYDTIKPLLKELPIDSSGSIDRKKLKTPLTWVEIEALLRKSYDTKGMLEVHASRWSDFQNRIELSRTSKFHFITLSTPMEASYKKLLEELGLNQLKKPTQKELFEEYLLQVKAVFQRGQDKLAGK
ncbi:MAG: hypothetical protein AB1540_16005 [Bdellovibrionota bacterium]